MAKPARGMQLLTEKRKHRLEKRCQRWAKTVANR